MGETIKQPHRAAAASRLRSDHPQEAAMQRAILAGRSDLHPLVQGAAFHGHAAG